MFLTFSKWWVIECTSSQSASKETFFQANRNYCLFSSSSVFSWCWIFLWCLVNVTPDGLLRVYITWVCQPSTLGFQVCKSFWHHVRMCAAFFSSRLFNLCWSYIFILLCSKLWYCWKLNFFLPFCLVEFLRTRHILTAFSITFVTYLQNNGHHLLGLSSKVFTFDHLFTYIVQTSLTVYQFLWLNSQKTVKTDAWAL